MDTKKTNTAAAQGFLRCRATFSQPLMVSMAVVSTLVCIELFLWSGQGSKLMATTTARKAVLKQQNDVDL